jgi:hypothetical protein
MADTAISDYSEVEPALNDLFELVDVSDTSMASSGTNKKTLLSRLGGRLLGDALIDGLILSNNGTDPDNDIDIGAGVATVTDGTNWRAVRTTGLTKRLDASWAVGTNQGGLDGSESSAGTPDVSTWYHVWLIMRSDTGVVDVLFSESATAPTMPANYDFKRRIGSVYNDSSGNIRKFAQCGDWFTWRDGRILDLNTSSPATSWTAVALSVPLGVKTMPIVIPQLAHSGAANTTWYLAHGDQADPSEGVFEAYHNLSSGNIIFAQFTGVRTDTSSQVKYKAANTENLSAFVIKTCGWIDPRGKGVN